VTPYPADNPWKGGLYMLLIVLRTIVEVVVSQVVYAFVTALLA
jgi:hypothetical protein